MALSELGLATVGKLATPLTFTVTANQAAGIDPLVTADANRTSILFSATVDFKVNLAATPSSGVPIYASARDGVDGLGAPNAFYHVPGSGLTAGATLVIWKD